VLLKVNELKFKSIISRFSGKRRIIEVPFLYRDDFKIGEVVEVRKIRRKKK